MQERVMTCCVTIHDLLNDHRSSNKLSNGPAAHSSVYQSECGDHWWHERQAVIVHWCRQDGQTPPVSKVFHMWPQLQNQRSPAFAWHFPTIILKNQPAIIN